MYNNYSFSREFFNWANCLGHRIEEGDAKEYWTIYNIRIKRDFLKHKTIKVRDNKLNRRFGVDITPLSR